MSGPPPEDLMRWTKAELIRELERQRAINREHAEERGHDPRPADAPNAMVDVAGDPHAVGGSLLDMRKAVLLDGLEVALVDTKRDEAPSMMMVTRGRVNYSTDRVEHAYVFGPDGAAAFVTEVMGLAMRAGALPAKHGQRWSAEFDEAMKERLNG